MTVEQLIELLNASQPKPLTPVQEWLLRSAWENKTYSSMAAEKHYAEDYLRKISGELWSKLSDFWGEPIAKLNLRSTLEPRQLTKAQQQLIQQDRSQKMGSAPALLSLEFPSGPVALDSKFYIERPPIEELAYSAITQPGCVLRIKAPRKMGKSSLNLRILERAASLGYRTASVDFQQADAGVFASLNAFLRWFCANVSEELGLEEKLDAYWKQEIGSKVSCTIYFQKYLLASSQAPVVLTLNEVNRVFEYPEIAKDFLPMLRYWHEQAKRVQVWQNLRLVVVYSTEIYIPLNLNQSPFNVGVVLKLPAFTVEQVQTLAQRYGLDWTDSKAAKQLREMVGGNPYLVRLALYSFCRGDVGFNQLLKQPAAAGGIYSDHLRSLLVALQEEPELTAGFKEVISADRGVKLSSLLAHKLDSMGLVNLEDGLCTPACKLYRLYFAEQFLDGSNLREFPS